LSSPKGQHEIEIRTTKTSQPKLAIARIKQIPIPLPPLPEQRKIASVLSTVQEAKVKSENVLSALKELKKSMMKHPFTYGAVSIEEAEKVPLKETEIGRIPEQWQIMDLGDIVTLQRGKDLPKSKQLGGEYPVVGASGILGYHNEYTCEGEGIVVGRSGSVGNVTYVDKTFWAHNTGLYVKDFHGNHVKFIYYLLLTVNLRQYATGVSVPTLNRNYVHSHLLSVPSLIEQVEITKTLSALDDKIASEQNKKTALEALFKTLLSLLMTGKMRVKDLEV
jgi:type I restriction enzyme S subunit